MSTDLIRTILFMGVIHYVSWSGSIKPMPTLAAAGKINNTQITSKYNLEVRERDSFYSV